MHKRRAVVPGCQLVCRAQDWRVHRLDFAWSVVVEAVLYQ